MAPGIYLVHKPVGPTSFSVVQRFLLDARKDRGRATPRICHGGTLDPFASGLLLILVEPATRLFDYLHDIPKIYQATIRWGVETDNGDPLGKVVHQGDSAHLGIAQIEEAASRLLGWQDQIPPATSAKRIDGERAYVRAHRGETVDLPGSRVYLHSADWLGHELPLQSRVRLVVRGGYYIRALARDLGRALGCGAHVAGLWRANIGPWADPGNAEAAKPLTGRETLPWLEWRLLEDDEVGRLRKGQAIPAGRLQPADWALPDGFPRGAALVRGFHRGRFCFLLRPAGDALEVVTPLRGGL